MTTEAEILELFDRANPVPDPDAVAVQADSGRFLAELIDGGRVAPDLESIDEAPDLGRRRWLLPAIAAAAAVFVIAGLVVVAGGDGAELVPVDSLPQPVPENDLVDPITSTPIDESPTPSTHASTTTSPPTETTAPPSTATPSELVPEVSVLSPGETLSTPVGDLSYVSVQADPTELPQWGYFESGGRYYGGDMDGRTWQSEDGLTWTAVDTPTGGDFGVNALGGPAVAQEGNEYIETGGTIWASIQSFSTDSNAAARLLRWDGARFVDVELPETNEPDVTGLSPAQRTFDLFAFRGELAVVASTDYSLDSPIDPGDDVVLDESGAVQFSSPDGSEVRRVGPWPGLDAEQLLERLELGLSHTEVLIGGDSGFVPVPSPGPDDIVRSLADVDGRLFAVTYRRSAAYIVEEFSIWATDDLETWTEIESPSPDDVTPFEVALVGDGNGAVLATLREAWFTDDGATWEQLESTAYQSTFATDVGWVMTTLQSVDESDVPVIWVSADGVAWQPVGLDCPLPEFWAPPLATVVGDKIFVSVRDAMDLGEPRSQTFCVVTIDKR